MQTKVNKSKNTKTVRPRTFVEMRAALTSAESDVLDIIFFMMDKGNSSPDALTYCIDAHDYEGLFVNNKGALMSIKRIYERIKNGADGLYELDLQFTEDTESIKRGISFRAIGAKAWNAGNYIVKIQLTPMFLAIMKEQQKKSGYAIYDLRYQFALKSEYAKRLYPMLIKFKSTGMRYDEASELREKLGVPPSYVQSRYLSIVDKAVSEINENTNLSVSKDVKYHAVSGGKIADNFVFTIKERDISDPSLFTKDQLECIDFVRGKLQDHISEDDVYRISKIANYDLKTVSHAFEFVSAYDGDVKDYTALMISAIKGNWEKEKKHSNSKKTSFSNFTEREYDISSLEKMLLEN